MAINQSTGSFIFFAGSLKVFTHSHSMFIGNVKSQVFCQPIARVGICILELDSCVDSSVQFETGSRTPAPVQC